MNPASPKTPPTARSAGLTGLITAARLMVFGQFRFKRRGQGLNGVHVVFGETVLAPPDGSAEPHPETVPGVRHGRLKPPDQALHQDLLDALDRLGDQRPVFRHLAYLSLQIGRAGLGGLRGLPVDVLRKAYDQMSLLSSLDDAKGLVELKRRLSIALVRHGYKDHLLTDEHATPSDFLQHAQPLVAEGRISEFLEASDPVETGPK